MGVCVSADWIVNHVFKSEITLLHDANFSGKKVSNFPRGTEGDIISP